MRDALPRPQRGPRVGAASAPPVVIGLGRDDRGDDGVGLDVVRALKALVPPHLTLVECGDDTTALLDLWADRPFAIVVDAVRSGATPGTVHRIEVGEAPLPSALGPTSTHGVSLGQAIALGRAIGRSPHRLVVYGVEARSFEPGTVRSTAVAAAVPPVARRIADELISSGTSVGGQGDGK